MANKWTAEEDQKLEKLRSEGFTAKEIAALMPGRTYAAVRARIQTICSDNKNRPWTEQEKEKLNKLKSEGFPNKYIAKALNRTVSAINTYVSRHWHGTMD